MVGRHTSGRGRSGGIKRDTLIGIGLIILVATIIVGGFVAMHQQRVAIAALDPQTYCPKKGPAAVHSVLIDRTDPLSDLQREALRKDILHWAEQVPKYAAFRIYEVGVGGALLNPIVDVCNPGDGSDASSLNSNPQFLKRRYREKFLRPVEAMFNNMKGDTEQKTSPIMQGVQAISIHDFGETGPRGDNVLIIVSDLLQNGPTFSLYKSVPDAPAFSQSGIGRTFHVDLSGVTVSIYLINRARDAKFQTDALGAFWIRWLTSQGAEVSAFKQLPG